MKNEYNTYSNAGSLNQTLDIYVKHIIPDAADFISSSYNAFYIYFLVELNTSWYMMVVSVTAAITWTYTTYIKYRPTSSGERHLRLKILKVIHQYRRGIFTPGRVGTNDMYCDIQTKGVTNITNVQRLINIMTGHGVLITDIPNLVFRHHGQGLQTMHSDE